MAFHSKEWANEVLRAGISELKNSGRARSGRFNEVVTYVHYLLEAGYPWQASVLRSWLFRYWSEVAPVTAMAGMPSARGVSKP
mgnify:CR=1 FL=1|jgi:hypothetical protein